MSKVKFLPILLFSAVIFYSIFTLVAVTASGNTGDPHWAKTTLQAPGSADFHQVNVDNQDNLYAVGFASSNQEFDFGNSVSVTPAFNDSYNALIVKYDPSGTAQWARSTTAASSFSLFRALVTDASGDVYAIGFINGTDPYTFGEGVTAQGPNAGRNAVIVKYAANGTAQWARSVAAASDQSEFLSVFIDDSDSIFVVGYINGAAPVTFDEGVTAQGPALGKNAVIVQYNTDGTALAATSVSSASGASEFYGIIGDTSNNLYAAGYLEGNQEFDFGNSVTVTSANNDSNALIVSYNDSLVAQWASAVVTSSADSRFDDVTLDSTGNLYAAGYLGGDQEFDFGNSVTVSGSNIGDYNALIVKYNSAGTAQWAKSANVGGEWSQFYSIAVDADDHLYVAGYIEGSDPYEFDEVAINGPDAWENALLIQYDTTGTAQWAKSPDSAAGSSEFHSVANDSDGNVFTAGYLYSIGEFDFGSGVSVTTINGGSNPVLVKYFGEELTPEPSLTPTATPTPTPEPTTEPTSAPTPTPTVAQDSSDDQTSNTQTTTPTTPFCDDAKPSSEPDLFQIDVTNTTAKLFFTPIGNTTSFYISFAADESAEQHGELVTLTREGVQSHTVYHLEPNTTYYFKVRGHNGCMPGEWSTIFEAKTRNSKLTGFRSFYKYIVDAFNSIVKLNN